MYGSQTPMYGSGSRTPMYGSQTPLHDGEWCWGSTERGWSLSGFWGDLLDGKGCVKEALRRWRGQDSVGRQRVLTQPLWGCCRQPHATLRLTDSASRWQPHACSERRLGPQQPQHTFQVSAGGGGGAADQDRPTAGSAVTVMSPTSSQQSLLGSLIAAVAPAILDCPHCRGPVTELSRRW